MIVHDLADAFARLMLAVLGWSAAAGALFALVVVLLTAAVTGARTRRQTEDA